ncbi:MAG: RNA 3'-terminal phosphate cyclase [Pseudomarimonas sp.]
MNTLNIDGSAGEGGGQVLRTALSLAILLQRPLSITRIRAGRAKPGLMRQHLAAVKAAQAISAADVVGATLGSSELQFEPQALSAGSYHIDIGSAGSASLVLQTVLPPLLRADGHSRLAITGGTHNMLAPSTCFLQRCFLPQLAKMGASVQLEVEREGLFPAGGGQIVVHIQPQPLTPITLTERGERLEFGAQALLAAVPSHVASRELAVLAEHYPQVQAMSTIRQLGGRTGPGNVLSFWATFAHVSELVTCYGERGVSAEKVASTACALMAGYLDSAAVVGEHLADQLLLPMWLAGGGEFITGRVSQHLQSNAELIAGITGARITMVADGKATRVVVVV